MKYPLLTWVLKDLLNPKFELELLDNRDFVYKSITSEKRTGLIKEIAAAINDPDFSWLEFMYDTGWFHHGFRNNYHLVLLTDEEVFEHFKAWIWCSIYPETHYQEQDYLKLAKEVCFVLQDAAIPNENGWVLADEIIHQLKTRDIFWSHLQPFHLVYLISMHGDYLEYERRLSRMESPAFFMMSKIVRMKLYQGP